MWGLLRLTPIIWFKGLRKLPTVVLLAIIGPHFAKRKETVYKTQMDGILVLVYKTAAQRTATHYSSTDLLNKANYLMAFCA